MDSFGRNSIMRDTNEELIPARHVAAKWKMLLQALGEEPRPVYSSNPLSCKSIHKPDSIYTGSRTVDIEMWGGWRVKTLTGANRLS